MTFLRCAASAALLLAAVCSQAAGYMGFSVSVDAESFSFNPTLKAVSVASVDQGSPAAAAGLEKGDLIVEVEGHVVAGAKASDLKQAFAAQAGAVHLKVKKAAGQVVPVTITPIAKP